MIDYSLLFSTDELTHAEKVVDKFVDNLIKQKLIGLVIEGVYTIILIHLNGIPILGALVHLKTEYMNQFLTQKNLHSIPDDISFKLNKNQDTLPILYCEACDVKPIVWKTDSKLHFFVKKQTLLI